MHIPNLHYKLFTHLSFLKNNIHDYICQEYRYCDLVWVVLSTCNDFKVSTYFSIHHISFIVQPAGCTEILKLSVCLLRTVTSYHKTHAARWKPQARPLIYSTLVSQFRNSMFQLSRDISRSQNWHDSIFFKFQQLKNTKLSENFSSHHFVYLCSLMPLITKLILCTLHF